MRGFATIVAAAATRAILGIAAPGQAARVDHLPPRLRTTESCLDFTPEVTGGTLVGRVTVTSRGIRYPADYCPSGRTERLMRRRFVPFRVRYRVQVERPFTGQQRTWQAIGSDGDEVDSGVTRLDRTGRVIDVDGDPAHDSAAYWADCGYRMVYGPWRPFTYLGDVVLPGGFVTRIRLVD